ncbi:unnamed protein product [Rotaria socialis]|uniref:AIG1-type G domain-containing protein n=1 Tax=Rotaria socialis TaxID=392032 RepID=A0A818T047_9BILA|nr:unnamed protein product [Rotaria socialis]CAF4873817.1 unnamed protein product [Rotaria socialis]
MEITDEIREQLESYRLGRHYVDVPLSPARTLILIGRTRTGKSTISALLKNSMYVPPFPTLFYGTDAPHEEQVNGLKIIDMPGFFNQNQHKNTVDLSNGTIETMLNGVMKKTDASVTLFAFVFNLDQGINQDDIKTMLLMRDKYPRISKQLMLILTHCEETDDIARTQLINNFFKHKDVVKENLRELFLCGVFFMGCIRPQSAERCDRHGILHQYANVLKMRNIFIEYIYSDLEEIMATGTRHLRSQSRQSKSIDIKELQETIYNTVVQDDEFIFKQASTRNIILMGRARTGKSTVAKTLEYPGYMGDKDLALFSETKNIEFHQLACPISKNGYLYNFNIIDTPGLYDQRTSKGQLLDNEAVTKLVLECMRTDMTNIHAFAFVFNLENGINSEDIDSMVYVKKAYPTVADYMMLILTHCEETSDERRNILVENFFQHDIAVKQNLREFFKLGIFYMGCLRRQLYERPDEAYAADLLENIIKMRARLLNFLIARENVYKIHDDPILRSDKSDSYCSIS